MCVYIYIYIYIYLLTTRNARANQIDVPSVYQSSAAQLHLPTRIVTLAAYKAHPYNTNTNKYYPRRYYYVLL